MHLGNLLRSVSTAVILAVLVIGCEGGKTVDEQAAIGASVQSNLKREASPEVSGSDLAQLASGNSAFSFDLYRHLRQSEGNLFYSPYCISIALAMTYAGARGETESQMAETLSFTLPQDRLHPAFNAQDLELAIRGEGAGGKDGQGFRLNIVNALWGQEGYEFMAEFLDLLAENFGAGLWLVDYASKPEEARITINDWVSDQTEGRIEDLIPPGIINELTRLVLTNAIYFNAAWALPFDADQTEDGAFHLLDGGQVTVPMMHQTESFGYAQGDGYQAVELLYDGRELSMVVLLPDEGQFEAFEGLLDVRRIDDVMKNLAPTRLDLSMPRWEFESDFGLAETLVAMGMPVAFSLDADFAGMTGDRDLFIRDVVHRASVAVDEAGTEATATTAVIMQLRSVPQEPIEVSLDRPFIFLIRDIGRGAILVVGGVVDAAGDHRIAMTAAVAATAADGPVTVLGASAANVSWPSFFETLEAVWSSQ